MALGGGTFDLMNKKLPGAYINFVSADGLGPRLSERGVVAFPFIWSWGPNEIQVIHSETVIKNSTQYFGVDWLHPEMQPIREIFENAEILLFYRLDEGTKAENAFATAKYGGKRGNDISISIQTNVDNDTHFDVTTLVDAEPVDTQVAATVEDLKSNDWVDWKPGAVLALTAGTPLDGGANGTASGAEHQRFLNALESYTFNAVGTATDDDMVKGLYALFTERQRDRVGRKFQTVLFDHAADFEGCVNLTTEAKGDDPYAFIYWTTGAIGGTAINKSLTNAKYTGNYEPAKHYTQYELEDCIDNGEFVFHQVNDDYRVLMDINSLTDLTLEKGELFQSNQTIRIIDQIATDIAYIFQEHYLGRVPNDAAGRISLHSEIVQHHKQLQKMRAIEDFDADAIEVLPGETKTAVIVHDAVTVVNAMEKLYMTVYVG